MADFTPHLIDQDESPFKRVSVDLDGRDIATSYRDYIYLWNALAPPTQLDTILSLVLGEYYILRANIVYRWNALAPN